MYVPAKIPEPNTVVRLNQTGVEKMKADEVEDLKRRVILVLGLQMPMQQGRTTAEMDTLVKAAKAFHDLWFPETSDAKGDAV
jgi:hypothetical protein